MKSYELFSAMSPTLAVDILEYAFANEKKLYHSTLEAVAQVRKVRAVFLERQPRAQRHPAIVIMLGRPALGVAADSLLRTWLLKGHAGMLAAFLDALKLKHEKGVIEDLPATMDEPALRQAIDALLAKYPQESVAVYLHAFNDMNEAGWTALDELLKSEPRLRLQGKT